jgi:hypothetical protein
MAKSSRYLHGCCAIVQQGASGHVFITGPLKSIHPTSVRAQETDISAWCCHSGRGLNYLHVRTLLTAAPFPALFASSCALMMLYQLHRLMWNGN